MIRIETTRGTLARRGFVDAEAAERVIEHWDDEHEPLLDVLAQCADPDHALASVDQLCERIPDLLSRLVASPVLARQLIMVVGASNNLTLHLLAHPEHPDPRTRRAERGAHPGRRTGRFSRGLRNLGGCRRRD